MTEHPWPFGGRIPLYENDVQVGWLGPIKDVRIGEICDPEIEVVDLEVFEDGTVVMNGQQVETTPRSMPKDPERERTLAEWFKQVYEDRLLENER